MTNLKVGGNASDTLTGKYIRHGSKLNGPVDLLMVHRTSTTTAKAQTFVLRVHSTGKREYVSSLWDGPAAGIYALEYKGIRYTVTMTDEVATVIPSAGGTGYSSVPPVAKSATRSTTGTTSIDTVL